MPTYQFTLSSFTCIVGSSGLPGEASSIVAVEVKAFGSEAQLVTLYDEDGVGSATGIAFNGDLRSFITTLGAGPRDPRQFFYSTRVAIASSADQFYVTRTDDFKKPASASADNYASVVYPVEGANPSTAGATLTVGPRDSQSPEWGEYGLTEGMGIVFWDYDSVSGDDILWVFPIGAAYVGSHYQTLYNGTQGSVYLVSWTIAAQS